jgi:iron complex transport system substrate-binding protein
MSGIISRRSMLKIAGGTALLGAVGACGSDPDETPSATPSSANGRVVVLVPALLDAALAVGVRPVAATVVDGKFPEHLKGLTDGVTPLNNATEPDVEKIASFEPDLILTQTGQNNAADQLRGIAPTTEIQFPLPAATWPAYVAKAAAALGREQQLSSVVAEHRQRVADAKTKVAGALSGATVSILRFDAGGSARQYGPQSFPGSLLVELGINHRPFPAGVSPAPQGYVDVSFERLRDVAGDIIFVMQIGTEFQDQAKDNPLWNSLPAVQNGRAFFVPQTHWLHIGYQSARTMLTDAVDHLT